MKKVLETAKTRFKLCEEAMSENREDALDDIKFARLGEQWPTDVREKREREGRPCLTINRLPAFIRQVVNDARLNTPAIKVHPVDSGADIETAEVLDGLIKSIQENSNAEAAFDTALESAVTNGFGYFRISLDYAFDDSFDMDINIERIPNPLSVYFDPHSTEVDASDWNYCFIVEDMAKDQFKASYPNAEIDEWESGDADGWVTEDTVRVAEYWEREEIDTELYLLQNGMTVQKEAYESEEVLQVIPIAKSRPSKTYKVVQRIITSQEVLEENEWSGRYIPVVPVFGDEIVAEGKRHFHSLIRQAKDTQRNYNYWRTAATEKVALATKAPWIGPVGAFDTDLRKWETANTETHPFIEFDGPIPPQQTAPSMVDAGSIQEALSASDDLKAITGIFDAALGARSNETSGKAIMARQREADVGTYHYIDNLSRALKYAGKVLLDLIPKVYNTPRIIRVLGYDGEPKNVQINQEFIANGIQKLHDLTVGKYDVVVKTGPSFSTQREEAKEFLLEATRVNPQIMDVAGDLIVDVMDIPGAKELSKRLKAMLPPQIQAMEQMDGLPPEAQAAIANAQQQIQQMEQLIQQGQQLLAEKDKEIEQLNLANKDKSVENQIKAADIEKKYEAQMAKIAADLEIARARIREEQRELIVDTSMEALKARVDAVSTVQTQPQILIDNVLQALAGTNQMIDELSEQMEAMSNKAKSISIKAPSGATYEGVVDNGAVQIKAPSGAIYEGQVTEQ